MKWIQICIMVLILMPMGCTNPLQTDESRNTYSIRIGETDCNMISLFGRTIRPGEKVKIVSISPGILELSVFDKNDKLTLGPVQVKQNFPRK